MRSLGALLLGRLTRAKRKKASPRKRKPPNSTETRLITVRGAARPSPTSVIPTAREAGLWTSDLIRPSGALKQTIEGFFLDQRSEHTRRAYGKDLERFLRFLLVREKDKGPEPVVRGILIAYKEFLLQERLEHTTVDRHLATLRSFFRWLLEEGWLSQNPAEAVRFLSPKRLSKTQGLSDEDAVRILRLPDLHTRVGSLHYAVLMVLLFCGLRRSELCSLRTSQLGMERGHPIIRLRGKGNRERLIPLQPAVAAAIQHYCRAARKDIRLDQPLFTPVRNNRTGLADKPLDPSMIFYIVKKYSREAGITTQISPHSLRATAISNARDRNVPDRAIQEFAGWASPDMITRYDKRRTAVEKSAALAIHYGPTERELPEDV